MEDFFSAVVVILFGIFVLTCVFSWIFLDLQFFLRARALRKPILGIPVSSDLSLENLLEKLTAELDYPDLISLTIDDKNNIVAECKNINNLIYIKDKFLFVVPYGYISTNKRLASLENGECLKEYIWKLFDPSIDLNPQNTLFKMNAKKKRRFITNCICIAIIVFDVIGFLIAMGIIVLLLALGV